MPSTRRAGLLGLGLGLGLATAVVHAAPADELAIALQVTVAADATAGCPSAASLDAEIRRRAAGAVLRPDAGRTATVQVTRDGAGYHGAVTISAVDASVAEAEPRELRAARCDDLVAALTLIAALALDPDAALDAGPPPPLVVPSLDLPTLAPPPPPPPPPIVVTPPAAPRPPTAPRAASLTLGPRLRSGVAPQVMPAGAVVAHVGLRGPLALMLGAVLGRRTGTSAEGITSTFTLATSTTGACLRGVVGLEVAACAAIELGWRRASVSDQPRAQPADRLWAAIAAEAAARWPARGAVFVEVSLSLAVPLLRDEFIVTPGQLVHQTGALLPQAGLAVGLRR